MATLGEDIEAAAAELSGGSTGTDNSAPADTGGGTETATSAPVASAGAADGETRSETTPAESGGARARDASGKFAKAEATETKAPEVAAGAPSSTGTASPHVASGDSSKTEAPKPGSVDTSRAPPSWRISAHQDWAKTPESVKQEANRRETEMARYVSENHPVRQFAQGIKQAIAPIEQSWRARGIQPEKAIADYARFDAALSSGNQQTQANALAQLVHAYGIPIEALATAIDSGGQQQPSMSRAQYEAQVEARIRGEYEAAQEKQQMSHLQREIQAFASSPDAALMNDDVRHEMAALIEAAGRRGVVLSLKDAYTRAVRANPETWAIVSQQEEAKRRATADAATQKSIAAGGSLKSRPASPISGDGGSQSLRADLEATATALSNR